MPRFRSLDPVMRTSPQLDGLSILARLVIVYVISEADDEGRLYGDPISVRVACFPRGMPAGVTEKRIDEAVRELVARGVLVAYAADGQEYLAVRGWKNGDSWAYQYIDRPKPSRFPAPPAGSCRIHARGSGKPAEARGQAEIGDRKAKARRPVGAGRDVDADVDATRREADADTDAKRASPSPSPAEAGSGEARSTTDNATASTTTPPRPEASRGQAAVKDVLAAMATKKVPRLSGSELAEKLRAERIHHCGPPHATAMDEALSLRAAGDPEFDRVGHAVLMKAQAARLGAESVGTAGGGS